MKEIEALRKNQAVKSLIVINDILESISANSTFGIDEVYRVYETFKSYDLLVAACEFAQKTGCANLEAACTLLQSAK